ncbi:MAG: hypothetical protein JSU92_14800 [Deltaproteobacteria bacterium]|nr:MAG: hypothetical protein JSU92_14800 [Deltaproteobacteria bacterium]
MIKNSIVKFRWHILVTSSYIIVAIPLMKRAYHLPLISDEFVFGVIFWLIGWVIIFTENRITMFFEFPWWILWRVMEWRIGERELMFISSDRERELSFIGRLLFGCIFIITSLLLIIGDIFENFMKI